ncbi:MAG: protein-L-isoaspartate(D-aspartate) O-methyltransferase [Bacteroidota bacterium]
MLDTFKHKGKRQKLVDYLRDERGVTDLRLLDALAKVPRHGFIENAFDNKAYEDTALPIASGQTISQPYTVAYQTEVMQLRPRMKVLEIGTGSGYQAAILCEMGMRVFSVEIDAKLHKAAKQRLHDLSYYPGLKLGDGSIGWPENGPYDRIIVTAASPKVPESLRSQLKVDGIMVVPVGNRRKQKMTLVKRISRTEYEIRAEDLFSFVPLRGREGFPPDDST